MHCWVIGTSPTKQIFSVKVEHDGDWGNVKDAIKEKKKIDFSDIDADTLDLWKVRHCTISHVVTYAQQRSPSVGPSVPAWNQKIFWRAS